MSNKKKPPVDRAVATIRKASGSDTLKVSTTRTVSTAMKASPTNVHQIVRSNEFAS